MDLFDISLKDLTVDTDILKKIQYEWINFMEGNDVNDKIIPKHIVESWKRCKVMGMDPLEEPSESIIKRKSIDKVDNYSNYIRLNQRLNYIIEEPVKEINKLQMQVNFNTRLEDGRLISVRNVSMPLKNDTAYIYDASEKSIGTTSLSLAAKTGHGIFIVGSMHYKKAFHNLFTISKPLFDRNILIGVTTISGINFSKIQEAFTLLILLHKILAKEIKTIKSENNSLIIQKKVELLNASYTLDSIVGKSKKIKELKAVVPKIAYSDLPVLISGESGTGKELFAQAIHNSSKRCNKPFVAINCGAMAKELVESELFGYEPGAFTGALKMGKKGKLEKASGGTIFFDEIDSMPLDVQVKLLRALSSNEVTKIGGVTPIPIDIRIISATKDNLLKKADNGKFREDFYYRIAYFNLDIPPLRDRVEDIPMLVLYFVDEIVLKSKIPQITVSDEYIEHLMYYFWRGNIRELKNVVHTSIALLENKKELTSELLPAKIIKSYNYNKNKRTFDIANNKRDDTELFSLKEELDIYEELILKEAFKYLQGNITNTAEYLNISTKSMYRKLEKYPKLREFKK